MSPRQSDTSGPALPRLTPYELAFGEAGFEQTIFPSLEQEAAALGIDPLHRDRFAFLRTAEDVLRQIVPDDSPPEVLEQFRALLFHAFNFWRFGERLYVVEPGVARYLVETTPSLEGWSFSVPHPSVYLQLPANLFWASVAPDATPEPVDGIFATAARADDPLGPPFRHLEILLVLGARRDRAGFSVIPFDTELGSGITPAWEDPAGREEGKEFANVLPGGEIEGLYSILTTTEAVKLLARILWYVDRNPADVLPVAPAAPGAALASRLAYNRIALPRSAAGEPG